MRREILLQALRHHREAGGADFLDVAAQNFFHRAASLNERQGGARLGADDASERAAIFGLDVVSDEARLDRGVRIENGREKIGRRLVGQRAQIWSDIVALSAQVMALGANIGKGRRPFDRVTGQMQRVLVFGHDFSAAARLARFPNRLDAFLNFFVRVLEQTLPVGQRNLVASDGPILQRPHQIFRPGLAAEQDLKTRLPQRRREPIPT